MIEIYTDGACEPNPGPGAFGITIIRDGDTVFEHDGYESKTTNQRMELMGPIIALEKMPMIEGLRGPVTVFSDSQYVIKGITDWAVKWKAAGWKRKRNRPVKNRDLWVRLDRAAGIHKYRLDWRWIRGHDGNEGNERADFLARRRLFAEIRNNRKAFEAAVRGFSRHHDFDPSPYLEGKA